MAEPGEKNTAQADNDTITLMEVANEVAARHSCFITAGWRGDFLPHS